MFKREGDDLYHSVMIDLKEALRGWKRVVPTIDGGSAGIDCPGPIQPKWITRFPGLGMPKLKKPEERGDFIISVQIKFPTSLTQEQKQIIKDLR